MSDKWFSKMCRRPKLPSTTRTQKWTGVHRLAWFLLFLVSWAGSPVLGAVPGWLRAAAQASLPKYPDDTNAVVLLGEQITTVTDAGEINTLHRQAYKILRPQGRDRGIVAVYFDNETHLTHLRGWAISADGKDYEVKEKDAIETSAFSESLYGDTRHKVLKIPAADPGSVIGYEYEQRQRPSIVQDIWPFQDDIPVRRARLELRLPPGWEYAPAWFNHGSQNAQQTGNNQWVWELTHIPAVEDEPGMPAWQALAGRLGLSFFPPRENASMKAQRSWRDVGIWYEQLAEGRRQPSLEIKQKVKELSAGAPTTLEKIAAVAKFVQKDIRYVAIEIGVGGYQPHSAQDIFTNRYGDCKDKATLLSTMLAELGVKSYYVAISHRRGVVAPEFPSPLGFDHVILALKLPDDVPTQPSMWSTMNHQELGRLLFFDPTDPLVPLGYLPETLQQNHGLLVADSGGDLVELPLLPPEANRLSRTAKLTLTPQGTLSGDVTEQRLGAPAAELRARLSGVPEAKRREHLEDFLGGFLNGAILESYSVENLEKSDAALTVQYHFKVTSYAKVAGDLLLLRPRVIGQKQEVFLEQNDKKERKAAVEFPATASQSDLVEIALPGGYKVDELPPPAKLDTGIVSYESKIAVAGDVLHYRRMYQIKNVIVPVGRVEELRNFYRQVAADERATAILKRIAP